MKLIVDGQGHLDLATDLQPVKDTRILCGFHRLDTYATSLIRKLVQSKKYDLKKSLDSLYEMHTNSEPLGRNIVLSQSRTIQAYTSRQRNHFSGYRRYHR